MVDEAMLVVTVAWFLLEREVDVLWVFAVAWFLPEREDFVAANFV